MKPIFQYAPKEVNLDTRKSLYFNMLKSRLIEQKMLILLRQGKISKWFSGIGQEAISVGVTMALQADEYILPMHRNLGVFTTRKYHYIVCSLSGKERLMALPRDAIAPFTLEPKTIKS